MTYWCGSKLHTFFKSMEYKIWASLLTMTNAALFDVTTVVKKKYNRKINFFFVNIDIFIFIIFKGQYIKRIKISHQCIEIFHNWSIV